jgi:hypothetical protein
MSIRGLGFLRTAVRTAAVLGLGLALLFAAAGNSIHARIPGAAMPHEHCEAERAQASAMCQPGCVQAFCSTALLPHADGAFALPDGPSAIRAAAALIRDGICPETATPPPRV